MSKRFLITAPGNLEIAGRVYSLEAGRTLLLSEEQADFVLRGPCADRLEFISLDETEAPALSAQGFVEIQTEVTKDNFTSKNSEWATPFAEGTVADPFELGYAPGGENPDTPVAQGAVPDLFDYVYEEPNFQTPAPMLQPLKSEETKDGVLSLAEASVVTSADIPILSDTAHWTKVKAHLLLLEAQAPVDYKQVQDIKAKYSKYDSIQKECDRILANQ